MTARHGFPARKRIKTASDYNRVYAQAVRSSDRYFTILARHSEGLGPRLGLAVSKRAAKKAVDRNRLKRVIRESFRLQLRLGRYDFVVMAKPMAKQAENAELRRSLERHFQRLSTAEGDA